jgi:hypothetical protein
MKVNAAYTLGLGAAAMFLLDPDRGRRRRAWLRDKCVSACRKTERAYDRTRRDLRNRVTGVWARVTALFRRSNVSDIRLLERVRAQIGRAVSHPHDVHVEVQDRWALLSGTVSLGEARRVLSVVERVPGIRGVQHRLVIQERPATEQTTSRTENRGGTFELTQNHWSPTARLLVGAAGSLLTIQGFRQGGALGSSLSVTGIVLLLRGATNRPYRQLLRGANLLETI